MIEMQQIEKSWNGKKVIHPLNLTIPTHQIYGLLGPNGAGKSTTLHMLLGFVQPDKGNIYINHLNMKRQQAEIRKQIGYIPENVNLYPYLSGLENLNYFCRLAHITYSPQELTEILIECGLQQNVHHLRTEKYSKGMRQKVGIAIAFAKKATTYLLDEPGSGLDPVASNELALLLRKLTERGATVLMVSHDIFRVRETCDKIGILKKGVLVQELNTAEISTNELEKIYLNYRQH